jgi:hypothetical protein
MKHHPLTNEKTPTSGVLSLVAGARIEPTYNGRLCQLADSTIYYKK